jgi:hypothetical protein
LECPSSSLVGVDVDVKGFEVIKERREYDKRRSAFDISVVELKKKVNY